MNAQITNIYIRWLTIWEKTPDPKKRAFALKNIERIVRLYEGISR